MRSSAIGVVLFALLLSCGGEADPDDPASAEQEPPAPPAFARPAPPVATSPAIDPARAAAEARRLEAERAEAARLAAEEAERARLEAERLAFERTYPLHGICYHFLAQVFATPARS